MSLDIIKEYLAKVGFEVDSKSMNDVNRQLTNFEKVLGRFSQTMAGKFALAGAAVEGFAIVATAAIGKFAMSMAAADQQVEILARRMLTTEKNARSLKNVMDAMGLKDLDQLKDINLNPELRKQFLDLRRLAAGLEPGQDIQQYLAQIRQVGYEFQKFQVIASYTMIRVAGYLVKYLQKPIEAITKRFKGFNENFAKNIDKWADRIAKVLSWVVRLFLAGVKLVMLLEKLPNVIKAIAVAATALGVAILAGPWGMLITAATLLMGLADDYFTYKEGGQSQFPAMWQGMDSIISQISTTLTNIDSTLTELATKFLGNDWGKRAKNALYGAGAGAATGAGMGAMSFTPWGVGAGALWGAISGGVLGWNSEGGGGGPKSSIKTGGSSSHVINGGSKKYRGMYQAYADQMAAKYGIPAQLFRNQITQESGWNPKAGSSAGAQGIAQIVPKWHPSMRGKTHDPYASLEYAAKLMSGYWKTYQKKGLNPTAAYRSALSAYNAGVGATKNGVAPYAETQNYVKRIMGDQPIKIDIHVKSTDPKQAAHEIDSRLQATLNMRNLRGNMA